MISTIKYILEHNSYLTWMVSVCRKLGIIHFLHIVRGNFERIANANSRKEFQEFYENHKEEFVHLFELLEDDFSRETLYQVLEFRKTWKMKALNSVIVEPQYFQSDIFEYTDQEILIDGGAYVGDTVEAFIKYLKHSGGGIQEYMLGNQMILM